MAKNRSIAGNVPAEGFLTSQDWAADSELTRCITRKALVKSKSARGAKSLQAATHDAQVPQEIRVDLGSTIVGTTNRLTDPFAFPPTMDAAERAFRLSRVMTNQ